MDDKAYWSKFMNNTRSVVDFNNLFREFHQSCAIPDHEGIAKVCEPRLAAYVSESLERIHFHGLDVEMANLTIEQPSIKVMKAEIHMNLDIDRSKAAPFEDYTVHINRKVKGAEWKTYAHKDDQRHFLDALNFHTHRPYLVSLTCLIESPMKLFVQNQNYSSILFGNDD